MSKFLDVTHYTPEKPYQLLPLKFHRLQNDHYAITNMVGELIVLPKDRLDCLVEGLLPSNDEYFADLRAKHFIYYEGETSPLSLLALKFRTRYARLPSFTGLHMFVVSLRCDHSCPYCQVSRQSEDKHKFDMTPEVADKALELVFRSPSPAIKIEFQGGEPLLNFELIKHIVSKAEEINLSAQRELGFVIATTMSLLTDEMLEYCKEHRILLSTSLDGPEDLHNANRPRPGRDSHQRFMDGLKKAREALGFDQISALMTTTERSLPRVKEIIDEYVRLGFDGIFLRALSPYGFAVKTKNYDTYDVEAWLKFYIQGLDYIIELNKNGLRFVEFFTATIAEKMLTNASTSFVDLMSPAGIGIGAVVYNYDGFVYASDESRMLAEMNDHSFRLGHVLENTYEEIFLSDQLLDALEKSFTLSVPMCSQCAFEPFCGADPVFHHATQRDIVGRKPESGFCKKNMSIFKHLIDLMRSDDYAKELLTSWANRC